jgi:site-specific DNA recombinase
MQLSAASSTFTEPINPFEQSAYVRVSLEREGMLSPELQMIAVTEHCRQCGYEICPADRRPRPVRSVLETAASREAIGTIEADQADVIVVWRWSRVTRNRLDWAMAVDGVDQAPGQLESATEGFDTTTSTGRFARGMLAEFAAFESDGMGGVWREVHAFGR